jgi:hypothetical protein
MSSFELQRIKNFKIWNSHGKVTFYGYTDVTGLDLDVLVNIGPGTVEVYPNEDLKPAIG